MSRPELSHAALGSLRCQRPSVTVETQQPKFVMKAVNADPGLRKQCEIQQGFDAGIASRVAAINIGDTSDLLTPIPRAADMRSQLNQPVIIAVAAALLFLLSFFGYRLYDRLTRFQGHEVVTAILAHADSMTGQDFEPFEGKAGLLGDWFFMNNALDNYGVQNDMADLDAAGWRLIQINGSFVAQHVVEEPPMIISILHADRHGIHTEEGWQYVEYNDWTAAVRQNGNQVTVVAMLDDEPSVRKFVSSLTE